MKKARLNAKQVENLRGLIHSYLHQKLAHKDTTKIFKKIKKYGAKTMQEAISLYRQG